MLGAVTVIAPPHWVLPATPALAIQGCHLPCLLLTVHSSAVEERRAGGGTVKHSELMQVAVGTAAVGTAELLILRCCRSCGSLILAQLQESIDPQ